jgi:lipoprotein-anchoring transpeptidase ErfK/SrfK
VLWLLLPPAVLLAVICWLALTPARPGDAQAAPLPTVTAEALVPAPAGLKSAPPAPPVEGPYLIAHLPGDVPAFDAPGGAEVGAVAGEWWGYASALPVIDQRDGFLQVRLQQRPNESTAWIAADGIAITTTPYRIVVDLAARRIKLLESGAVVMDLPTLIGRPATPTPAGHFFVTMLQPGPSAGYGELVLVLSAHSETIDNWQGSGDAVSAIHGPLGDEASIDTGAATTNGCLRVHMADLDALAALVPPGAPVDIS